jgi:hypothetical protein
MFFLKYILNLLSCVYSTNFILFLNRIWVDYFFIYFTLPTPMQIDVKGITNLHIIFMIYGYGAKKIA